MNFKPDNFENLTFKKSFTGYDKAEVDEFISKMVEEHKKCCSEIVELKSRILILNETVQHYKTIEEAMQHCLIIAQHTCDEIISKADDKAKKTIHDAETAASKLVSNANMEVVNIRSSLDDAKNRIYTFRKKTEALINAQMDVLKQLSSD